MLGRSVALAACLRNDQNRSAGHGASTSRESQTTLGATEHKSRLIKLSLPVGVQDPRH